MEFYYQELLKKSDLDYIKVGGKYIIVHSLNAKANPMSLASDKLFEGTLKQVYVFLDGMQMAHAHRYPWKRIDHDVSNVDVLINDLDIATRPIWWGNEIPTYLETPNVLIYEANGWSGFTDAELWRTAKYFQASDWVAEKFEHVQWSIRYTIVQHVADCVVEYNQVVGKTIPVLQYSWVANSSSGVGSIEPIQYGRCATCGDFIPSNDRQRLLMGMDSLLKCC